MFIILNDDEDDETVGCCYEAIWPVEARVRSGNVSTRGFIVESLWRIVSVDGHFGYRSSGDDIVGVAIVVAGCVKRRVNVHSILT
jgi:hypothetical protein